MSRHKTQLLRGNKKVLQQNLSSKRNNIIQIVNINFNLIMDEEGKRQPIGLFMTLCINVENEKMIISKQRKINAEEEIPRDSRQEYAK